jgi:DNA-binding transcriptional LysR family regulator
MRFDRLDLNLLVALDALLTECHVTRAGEKLLLSQSAMSGALARLRDHFQDDLIMRAGRQMVLTPLGQSLRAQVHDVLLRTQQILDQRPRFDPASEHRRFSIVSSDFINAVLMIDVARRVATLGPNVELELLDPLGGHIPDDLNQGDADLLIVPESFAAAEHPWDILVEDRMVCVVWKDNKKVGKRISIDQYAASKHVAMNFGRARTVGLEGVYLDKLGIKRQLAAAVPQFTPLPEYVIGTEHIATVPNRLATLVAKRLPIRVVAPEIDFPPIVEVVQWHRHRDGDPGIAWMRDLLRDAASKSK